MPPTSQPIAIIPREYALVALVVLTAALAGCTVLDGPTESQSALPEKSEATERYESLDTLNATVTTVRQVNGNTTTSVRVRKERVGTNKFRSRYLTVESTASDPPTFVAEGGFAVSNGSTIVVYNPRSEKVLHLTVPDPDEPPASKYGRLVSAARRDATVSRPTPGVAPLPSVPPADGTNGTANESAAYRDGNVTVEYAGTETVDGRPTYKLSLEPTTERMALVEETLWLDREYLYPVKRHSVFEVGEDRYEYTTTYENVTFNPTLARDTFELDRSRIPSDANRTRYENYESREALTAASELPVPDPKVPSGFEFGVGVYRPTDPRLVALTYESDQYQHPLHVVRRNETKNLTGGETVSVGGQQAVTSRQHGSNRIEWNNDGHYFSVSGPVGNETLQRVAASVVESD